MILGPILVVALIQLVSCFGGLVALGLAVALVVYGIRFLIRYINLLAGMRDALSRA